MPATLLNATVSDLVRCGLALMVCFVASAAVLMQVAVPDWFLLLGGSVFGFYFGVESPKMLAAGRGGSGAVKRPEGEA